MPQHPTSSPSSSIIFPPAEPQTLVKKVEEEAHVITFDDSTVINVVKNTNGSYAVYGDAESYHEYTSQYLVHLWIVTILSLATFIKFYYLYKAALLVLMFVTYSLLIFFLMNWTSGM